MIASCLTLSLSAPTLKSKPALPTTTATLLTSLRPSLLHNLKPFHHHHHHLYQGRRRMRSIGNGGTCRASGLSHDAPFAFAIGASVLTSLLFPVTDGPDDDAGDSALDSTDSRFAVMGIISVIPYFNWLSWVFAWLDTGKRRYAVYSLVYLAPYFRSNLSLSPEESWLPIASIVICIIHVQLEASIRNGDLQGFQFFSEALKNVSSTSRKKDQLNVQQGGSEKGKKRDGLNLPSSDEESRNKIRGWQVPRGSPDNKEHSNQDGDEDQNDDKRRKH